jgi:hypothetical protein
MPITNVNNDHFSAAQITEAKNLAGKLFTLLSTKTRNLTPKERKEWGSIKEQNKLVAHKVLDYANNQPNLKSPDVDYDELAADWNDRSFLAAIISLLQDTITVADNIRITHDWDTYQASRQDYRHAEYRTKTDGGAAFENKYSELKDFFTTNPNGNTGGTETPDGETPSPTTEG